MKRRIPIIIVITFLIFGYIISNAATYYDPSASKYNWERVEYSYEGTSSDEQIKSYFMYSNCLFLQDATVLNGEMAKMCVALAASAYDRDTINDVLGFHYDEKNDAYERRYRGLMVDEILSQKVSYERKLTYEDNDYVAYTIAKKMVDDYTVYCVPIRGTAKNAEWFSDFNLYDENLNGGKDHAGFHKAASIIYNELFDIINSDDVASDKTILLFTGHSRGAAVANILTYQFTRCTNIPEKQIFGYTFACPSVSMATDKSLKNLFNFNNPGDLITLLPMEDWKDCKYSRHGQDIDVYGCSSLPIKDNVYKQFKRICGKTCLSEDNPYKLLDFLHENVSSRKVFLSDKYQVLFKFIAYALGGHTDVSLSSLIWNNKFTLTKILGIHVAKLSILKVTGVYELFALAQSFDSIYQKMVGFIEANEETLKAMTKDGFRDFYDENKKMIDDISEYTGSEVTSAAVLLESKTILNSLLYSLKSEFPVCFALIKIFVDFDGKPLSTIFHAHTPFFYVVLVNTLYFGYEGWREYDGNETITIDLKSERIGVLSIGSNCFYKCNSLESVVLPDDFGVLCSYCFGSCGDLTSVSLPLEIKRIESGVFCDCTKLQGTFELPEGIPFIDQDTFKNCSSLEGVVIPESVERVYPFAFSNCSNLKDITLPIGTEISRSYSWDKYADVFKGCTSINHVTLTGTGKMQDYIGEYNDLYQYTPWYCSGCDNLVVDLSEGITEISPYAFAYSKVTQVNFPESLQGIGYESFRGSNLKSLSFPHSIGIGYSAFAECKNLSGEVVISDGSKYLSSGVFANCTSLKSIILPESLIEIGPYAFSNCTGLKHVTIPCNIKIPNNGTYNTDSFYGCVNISSVNIIGKGESQDYIHLDDYGYYEDNYKYTPWYISEVDKLDITIDPRIARIGNYTFCGCDNIKDISLSNNVTSIGDYAFEGCSFSSFTIPDSVETIGKSAFSGCSSLNSISIPGKITTIEDYTFASCKNLKNIIIPNSVKKLGDGVFYACSNLVSATLPNDITSIGRETFCNCVNLTDIKIPENVISIGVTAFFNCSKLEGIIIPYNVSSIGDSAFGNCSNLKSIAINRSAYNSKAFPDLSQNVFHYYYNVSYANNGHGTVSGKGRSYGTDVVSLTIIPETSYEIVKVIWDNSYKTEELTPDENGNYIMPDSNYSAEVRATFKKYYEISLNETTGGTVSVDKKKASEGEEVIVTAVPSAGYYLYDIKINNKTIIGSSFTIGTEDAVIEATFKKIEYTVSVKQPEHGTAFVDMEKAVIDDEITVAVSPDTGYEIDVIKVNGIKIEGTTFKMCPENAVVEVFFKKTKYKIDISIFGCGSATANKGKANYEEDIILCVKADPCYELKTIKVNGYVLEGTTFKMPAKETKVEVIFNVKPHELEQLVGKPATCEEDGVEDCYKCNVCGRLFSDKEGKTEVSEPKAIKKLGHSWDDGEVTKKPTYGAEGVKTFHCTRDGCTAIKTNPIPAKLEHEYTWFGDDNGNIYCEDENGNRVTEWLELDGEKYYLDPGRDGKMVVGWFKIDGYWYFFDKTSGVMATEWLKEGKYTYYLDPETGIMATKWKLIGSKWYYFGSSGHRVAGWKQLSKKWYYFDKAGALVTGAKKIGKYYYLFNKSGVMQKSGWKKDSNGNTYYLKKDGKAYIKKWVKKSKKWYYFGSNGKMVKGKSLKIGKKVYKFKSDGVCKNKK